MIRENAESYALSPYLIILALELKIYLAVIYSSQSFVIDLTQNVDYFTKVIIENNLTIY